MASELMDALRALAREKNIDEYAMLDRLETSLAQTYRKILDLENDCRVVLDRETGRISVFELVPVGGTEEEPIFEEQDVTPADVSRTAAQTAKNVIIGMIRDAEREQIFDEYQDRVGDAVTGTVQQSDARYTLIKLREGVEALLPPSEQPRQRALRPQPAHQGLHHRGPQDDEGTLHRRVAHPSRAAQAPLRARGPRDLRRHRRDQERGPRAGHALQDRRVEPRARARPGRRVRRTQGQPRAHGRRGASRRAHRRRPVERRPRSVRRATRCLPPRSPRSSSKRRSAPPPSSSRTTSSRSPSARRARTPASPRSSRAGASTSRASSRPSRPASPRRARAGAEGEQDPGDGRCCAVTASGIRCRNRSQAGRRVLLPARQGGGHLAYEAPQACDPHLHRVRHE